MRDYYITYVQGESGPGLYRIHAANDDDAIVRLRRFIEQGTSRRCRATIQLDDDREYEVRREGDQLTSRYCKATADSQA